MPFFSQVVNLFYMLYHSCLGAILVQIRCTFYSGAKVHRICTENFVHF